MSKDNKWIERIEKIKKEFDIETDSKMAGMLGISRASMHAILTGKSQPSTITKLKIMDKLGFAWAREALLEILPEEKKDKAKTKWNKMSNKLIKDKD